MSKPPAAPVALSPLSITRMLWMWKIPNVGTWLQLSAATLVYAAVAADLLADTLILVDSQKILRNCQSTVSADWQDRLLTINQQILSSTRMQKIIDDFGLYARKRRLWFKKRFWSRCAGTSPLRSKPG
jgi:hypothetical protein